jgi:hypothetical protein
MGAIRGRRAADVRQQFAGEGIAALNGQHDFHLEIAVALGSMARASPCGDSASLLYVISAGTCATKRWFHDVSRQRHTHCHGNRKVNAVRLDRERCL